VKSLDKEIMTASLDEQLSFEDLIANLSAKFVNVAGNKIDQEIEEALRVEGGEISV
jgi:hypothetical protein